VTWNENPMGRGGVTVVIGCAVLAIR
jgi:hypothetical protein